jgi:TonB family protein
MRLAVALLFVSLAGCGPRPVPFSDYPPHGFRRARELYAAGRCEEYLRHVAANGKDWYLYHFDASLLNLWNAECLAAHGSLEGARQLWRAVLEREPETGIGDWARARLAGHSWTAARPVSIPQPVYPRDAIHSGYEGLVHVTVTVDLDGTVREALISGASPGGVFDQAIIEAFRGGVFEPARRDGREVVARYDTFVRFMLR